MATEQTPKKGKGRTATLKDQDIAAYKARIESLAYELKESNKHKSSWESKCNELWKKIDKYERELDESTKKIDHLECRVKELIEELESKDRAYKRLVGIAQSLSKSLNSAAYALNTISGGF